MMFLMYMQFSGLLILFVICLAIFVGWLTMMPEMINDVLNNWRNIVPALIVTVFIFIVGIGLMFSTIHLWALLREFF